MLRTVLAGILSVGMIVTTVRAESPDRVGAARPAVGDVDRGAAPDFKVVFWYDRRRPLDTFKYQVYDLRKSEFTPEVGRWLTLMKEKYPGYEAYAREVVLAREEGGTEKLKIGSAIIREFLVVGTEHGYDFGGYAGMGRFDPRDTSQPSRPSRVPSMSRPNRLPASPYLPPAASSPFPLPYPRPHP
jgi:hypothetical protein